MNRVILSLLVLAAPGALLSVGAAGCSSSSGGTSTGHDSGTADTGVTVDSGTSADTGSSPTDSGAAHEAEAAAACVTDASFVDPGLDGGPNTACAQCIQQNCVQESCECLNDPARFPPPKGAAAPWTGCEDYVVCARGYYLDGGSVNSTFAYCDGLEQGKMYTSTSQATGQAAVLCIYNSCLASCLQ